MQNKISVLFCRSDSVYKGMPGVDVWDAGRDARNWTGGNSGVFHPPCAAWGRLRHFARPAPGEKDLAVWSVAMARRWGGVVEHPAVSGLWKMPRLGIPLPGRGVDKWGGFSIAVPQSWWGHPADKMTRLYVVGCAMRDLPEIPFKLGEAEYVVSTSRRKGGAVRPALSTKAREATPLAFAAWLVEVGRKCMGQLETR